MADLALFVVYARDIDASVRFYERIGIEFQQEQHGKGPVHHAGRLGTTVFEIYPARNEETSRVRLGFAIDALDATCEELAECVVQAVRESPWGRRAILADPDGNRVELTERDPP